MYGVFKAAENNVKDEDEECIQLSDERNQHDGKNGKDSIHPHQNELCASHPNSHTKNSLTDDPVAPSTDTITVTKREFIGPHNCGGTETLLAVPQLTGDAVEPTSRDVVVDKHQFAKYGISQGSYRSGNIENTRVEMPDMSNIDVSDSGLQCKVCGYRFKKRSYLEEHMTFHTGERPYKCSFCDKKFRVKFSHTVHERGHKGELPQCKVCGRRFKRRRYLERHMTIHTGERPYKCSFCDKKFWVKSSHRTHELGHKGELPQCKVCGGRYVSLQHHMLIHSTDWYKHVCSVCMRAFRRAGHLKRHMILHTDERPYTCWDCGRTFWCVNNLKSHIRGVHTVEEKNHVCSVFGKMFTRHSILNTHIRTTHTDQKFFQRETCGKYYKMKVALERHQTIHSSEKRFPCSTCGKCFRVDTALRRHKLIHTGEQPYECSVCKMRFNEFNSMKRHMLIHTGEKPYSCNYCGTRFTQSGGLASHRLRHCPSIKNINS